MVKKQQFSKYSAATVIQPERVGFVVPDFLLSVPVWSGASTVLAEFPIGNTNYYFSLKLPIAAFGSNFIAAIRWKVSDTCYRYKLWDNALGVLYYPIYAGERIGLNATLEIWSINSASAPTLDADTTLYSSVLVFPSGDIGTGCSCDPPSSIVTLVQTAASPQPPASYCNPFCNTLC